MAESVSAQLQFNVHPGTSARPAAPSRGGCAPSGAAPSARRRGAAPNGRASRHVVRPTSSRNRRSRGSRPLVVAPDARCGPAAARPSPQARPRRRGWDTGLPHSRTNRRPAPDRSPPVRGAPKTSASSSSWQSRHTEGAAIVEQTCSTCQHGPALTHGARHPGNCRFTKAQISADASGPVASLNGMPSAPPLQACPMPATSPRLTTTRRPTL